MRKILIIDDDQAIIDMLTEAIGTDISTVTCLQEQDFNQAVARMESERPDAVILDLLEGPVVADPPGQRTWQSIWNGRFCPVIIYTAFGGPLTPPVPDNHPFVKLVVKGAGTQTQVIQHLQAFMPLVASIDSLHRELDLVLQRVLRDTAGAAVIPGTDATHLVHAARRRVAAFMDEKTATEGRPLFSWEQYLIPAFGDNPLTGDVLRVRTASPDDPAAYRVVLSPSCDLVAPPKITSVLLAKCCGSPAVFRALGLTGTSQKVIDKVRDEVLTQGFRNGMLPLPSFPGRIPLIAASLKDLEVVRYDQIGPPAAEGTAYERIASIDSPFREQIAWAFLSTVARPGMPDRDLMPWARDIVTAANSPAAAGPQPPPQAG
ncbi:MAG: hypothetical protein L6R00_10410 [Phycisphaerae bacterium]|nr:hypothetical protein [Phycisphaerae bacterium]